MTLRLPGMANMTPMILTTGVKLQTFDYIVALLRWTRQHYVDEYGCSISSPNQQRSSYRNFYCPTDYDCIFAGICLWTFHHCTVLGNVRKKAWVSDLPCILYTLQFALPRWEIKECHDRLPFPFRVGWSMWYNCECSQLSSAKHRY